MALSETGRRLLLSALLWPVLSSGCTSAATPVPTGAVERIVGLGDSVMSGDGCGCAGIVDAYAALERRRGGAGLVTATNLGRGGAAADDLGQQLTDDPGTRAAVADADVVIVIAGANDIEGRFDPTAYTTCGEGCWTPAVRAMGASLGTALGQARALRGGRPTTFLVTGYWNVFRDGAVGRAVYGDAGLAWARTVTSASNTAIRDAAAANGMTYVDLVAPFEAAGDATPLLAADGDHPNAAGVEAIARALSTAHPH